jgi:hypothetical protein
MKMKYFVPMLAVLTTGTQAATVNGFEIAPYGFLKASAMYSDKALASYNNINLSAPTHAVAETRPQDKTSRFSLQTQQSRIGTTIAKDKLSARFEFDFIDFNKSSPTTQMNPRVRIASMTYAWDNNKVIIGQDWDLFSPTTTFTFDYVGLYFLAGNSGFMRQQAQYLKTLGDWELGAALGMAGNNPGASDTDLELGKSPTYALRLARALKDGRIGLSAIYSTLHFNQTTTAPSSAQDAYGYNAFYEQKVGSFNIKSEAYYGQNLANLGALTLARGTAGANVREYGATLTGQYLMNETQTIFGGVGMARIDNKANLVPFNIPSTGTSANVISAPGVRSNFLVRAGYEHKVTPDLSWLSEISRYETDSKLANNEYKSKTAYSLESGIQLRF